MASSPPLAIVLSGVVEEYSSTATRVYDNINSSLNGYPYEFSCILSITLQPTLDQGEIIGGSQFDASYVKPGMWLMQSTGYSYLIVNIIEELDYLRVRVTVRDVDMFNALSDPTQSGNNNISENSQFAIVNVSDDGIPIVTYSVLYNFLGSWIYDAVGRFAYRNFIEKFYNFDINNKTIDAYSNYSVGQLVYIGLDSNSGSNCFLPIDPNNEEHVDKVFGRVSSVNQPEMGNIYVQPFGKVITSFPFDLPGNPGDVLYYDGSNSDGVSYTSTVKPADHPIPMYIKITDKVASVLYGSVCSANNSTGSGSGPGPGTGSGSGYISGPYIIKLYSTSVNTISSNIEEARDPEGNSLMTNSNWTFHSNGASVVTVTFSNVLSNGQFTNFRKIAATNSNATTFVSGSISGAGSFVANVRYTPSTSTLVFANITGSQYGYNTCNSPIYILFDLNASPNFILF